MWLDFDNGRRRTHDRFSALGKARNMDPNIPLFYYTMPTPWLQSTDIGSIGGLALRARDKGAKLICIDNLGCVTGDAEENSGDMAKVMSNFRQLAEDTQAAIVLIHHQRKSNGMSGRAGDSLRGHSSIEAALDLALLVEREPYADTIKISATKVRGDDVLPFRAQFTYEHDDRGELETAEFFGLGTEDTNSTQAIEKTIKEILSSDGAMNQSELKKAIKDELPEVGMNRIHDCIKHMASDGRIHESNGDRNKKVYSV